MIRNIFYYKLLYKYDILTRIIGPFYFLGLGRWGPNCNCLRVEPASHFWNNFMMVFLFAGPMVQLSKTVLGTRPIWQLDHVLVNSNLFLFGQNVLYSYIFLFVCWEYSLVVTQTCLIFFKKKKSINLCRMRVQDTWNSDLIWFDLIGIQVGGRESLLISFGQNF